MYNKTIKEIIGMFKILPESLVIKYLRKKFPGLSPTQAHNAIYAAARSRFCVLENGFVKSNKFVSIQESAAAAIAKTFRVLLDFLPDAGDEFTRGDYPWEINCNYGQNLIQICFIPRGSEMAKSRLIATEAIPADERNYIKRICVVASTSGIDKLKKAGFCSVCYVDDHYSIKMLRKYGKDELEEAWADVPLH